MHLLSYFALSTLIWFPSIECAAVDPSKAANQSDPANNGTDPRLLPPRAGAIPLVLQPMNPKPAPQAIPLMGGPTGFGAGGTAYHGPDDIPMKVLDTNVDCQKTFMVVTFKLSRPFFGYIYPFNNFDKCVLFVGHGETDIRLQLSQDMCGAPPPPRQPGWSQLVTPVIEHRLMIQWEPDLVQEFDTNILVRCDRPDDYNRTIKFDLSSIVEPRTAAIVRTHPGPQMWMEIQRGEGPKAKPLEGSVFLGETLTLVFTLSDEAFHFDSNVMHCWATDGNTARTMVTWTDPNAPAPPRPLLTQIPVIENSCSVKPTLFGHFQKMSQEFPTQQTTTQWVYFKAFRFPTTSRVLIQCDIQVCFQSCFPLPPCSEQYNPRGANRRRRAAGNDTAAAANRTVNPESLSMFRSIEVLLPEDTDLPKTLTIGTTTPLRLSTADCIGPSTFYGIILGMGIIILLLIGIGAAYVQRQNKKSLSTPTK